MIPSTSSVPIIYVDTCVISGIVNGDMSSADSAGFAQIVHLMRESKLTICASTVAREEIDRIPPQYRERHLKEYEALRLLRASNATWIEADPALSTFGLVVEHPTYSALRSVLRDENDARHLFLAQQAGVPDVVTVDYRSILNRSAQLRDLGLNVYSPAQYVSNTLEIP